MERLDSPEICVAQIIKRVGKTLHVAAPLAAGKPNHLLNALYRRALKDPEIELTIYSALTLELPKGKTDLEKRFLEPMVERVFGNYPDLEFELARTKDKLPKNVRVCEFYYPAGKFLTNTQAQRDYISTNYTYVARDLLERGINVLMQQVAKAEVNGRTQYSLSCNADVTPDLIEALSGRPGVVFAAQVNQELPFMYGEAQVDPSVFDFVVDERSLDYRVFSPPKLSVSRTDYAIGLHASTLVRDGGSLQIGIGSLGDALAYGLTLRHHDNARYQSTLTQLGIRERHRDVIERIGGLDPFAEGLFGATEMFVDVFAELYRTGILKRRVYDDVALQRLVNEGKQGDRVTESTVRLLIDEGAIRARPTAADLDYLRHFGVLREGVELHGDALRLPSGRTVAADFDDPETLQAVLAEGLGDELQHGAVAHSAFFLGPASFYRFLRDMPEQERRRIQMRSVQRVNQLYGHQALDMLQRRRARFMNTTMMMSLLGAATSDAFEDGRVVSGVGGQYNFVAMAHALPDGRSILQLRSTRMEGNEARSNILWSYGHTTIPRHQRDIVVTEYGIADLRAKTDEEVIEALLLVSDARFQEQLVHEAKAAGKLRRDYTLPERARQNTVERLDAAFDDLENEGLFPTFPFGTDLTQQEIVLGAALKRLKKRLGSRFSALDAVAHGLSQGSPGDDVLPYLARMGLDRPSNLKETVYQRVLSGELRTDPRVTTKM